jgi:hypothetical protein
MCTFFIEIISVRSGAGAGQSDKNNFNVKCRGILFKGGEQSLSS